jgi:hypothetical protein
MAETFQNDQIVAGWNNAGTLVNIETITVSGTRFEPVDDLSGYEPGAPYVDGDGITKYNGFARLTWISGSVTHAQYWYIHDTILAGAFSGKVTVKTRTASLASYANYNAILTIDPSTAINWVAGAVSDFVWKFVLREAL